VQEPQKWQEVLSCPQLVADIPNSPNLRATNLKTRVSKEVRKSLTANDGTFHLKNKGITLIAESATPAKNPKEFYITLTGDGSTGIVDGGHTYSLIRAALDQGEDLSSQHVRVDIRTGVAAPLVPVIAEGLNASTAVSQSSLLMGKGGFEWLIEQLPEEEHLIAWRQNDKGLRVDSLLPLIHALYSAPPASPQQARASAYSCRSRSLQLSADPTTRFTDYAPLARDAFALYERIERLFGPWAEQCLGLPLRGSKQPLFDREATGAYPPLSRGLALPLLGAFRPLVVEDQGRFRFNRDLAGLFSLLEELEHELKNEALRLWNGPGVLRNVNELGKSENVWAALEGLVSGRLAPGTILPASPVPASEAAPPYGLDLEELAYLWEGELAELKCRAEADREELAAARTLGGRQAGRATLEELSRTAHISAELVRQHEAAISRVQAGLTGICCECGGGVEEARMLEARLSVRCVACAASSRHAARR
jgi:RNA polymerase-binding transcription factor DksA